MDKKYSLTDETITLEDGTVLHRIKAEKDIPYDGIHLKVFYARKGDLGGWIESEKNLSQDGLCWVKNEGKVYGNAKVCENTHISGDAKVYGNAIIGGFSSVSDNAKVYGNAEIYERGNIKGNAQIYGNAKINSGWVYDNAKVYGNAQINGVKGWLEIYGNAKVFNKAKICSTGSLRISGNTKVYENAQVVGKMSIFSNVEVFGNAKIYSDKMGYVLADDNKIDYEMIINEPKHTKKEKQEQQEAMKEYFSNTKADDLDEDYNLM